MSDPFYIPVQSYQRICSRCVMDDSDASLVLDPEGVCQYCRVSAQMAEKRPKTQIESERRLEKIVRHIKDTSRGQEYDTILGISGGVDSSYCAHLAKELGLKPLVVHLDNGWNSELAVKNIKILMDACNFDLRTHVVNWPEFRDIQRSLLFASVLDVELVTDHAFFAMMLNIAREMKIKHSLVGYNGATESFMPPNWNWLKSDRRNLLDIHAKYGTKPIKTVPTISFWTWLVYERLGWWCKPVFLLENMIYKKNEALQTLQDVYGFRYYGGKHYESLFTKFYQAYLLPKKFGIDKRKVHLSSLVTNGEMTREQALEELRNPPYKPEELALELPYVIKKLGFTMSEFEKILDTPVVPHSHFASDKWVFEIVKWLKLRILGRG